MLVTPNTSGHTPNSSIRDLHDRCLHTHLHYLQFLSIILLTFLVISSQILGHKVEFFLNSRCNNRVYLASLASIKKHQPCHARMVPGSKFPTLFPIVLEKKARTPNAFLAYRSHHYLLLKAERPGITFGEICKSRSRMPG